jgi:hypothetical protein
MLPQHFENLKEFILSKNAIFHKGFANAYRDELRNAIYARTEQELIAVLPNDSLGNYFYLRHEDTIQHEALQAERLADSGSGRLSFLDIATIQLVAMADKACAYTMVENLRNTLMMYEGMNAQPTSSLVESSKVIMAELPRNEQQLAILQRLKNETIVRITIKATTLFTPSNCINNPCN